ncbi:hypothetical protein JAAARDRAFT_103431, partial [Jaapia argillacea MUCL 33604]
CRHYFDKSCILDLFQAATRDETLFPPRCCRRSIPFSQVRPHMSAELSTLLDEKKKEFGTLRRVYCSNASCSRFLGEASPEAKPSSKQKASKVYVCWSCGTQTCSRCKTTTTTSPSPHTCQPSPQTQQLLSFSQKRGWARCPGCTTMVELAFGCYHMICRCKTQFCYLCGKKWKRCKCP